MAPVPSSHDPPTNIAQMGMGWNILSGTIDLGLTVFDAVFIVKDWIWSSANIEPKKQNRRKSSKWENDPRRDGQYT
jgi:hypothetical protein